MRGRKETPEQFIARFWSHVDPPNADGHRMWTGATEGGYGIFQLGCSWGGPRTVKAHRVALWLSSDGTLDLDGPWHGLHDCDTPGCCEPTHLMVGDHPTNMQQMVERGRAPRGEDHNWGKLTDEQIVVMRSMRGQNAREVAELFGVTRGYVWAVWSGKRRPEK